MAVTCAECRYKNGAHTAWCSKNKRHPTPKHRPGYEEDKRHFKERPDDGRTPGTKKPRKKK